MDTEQRQDETRRMLAEYKLRQHLVDAMLRWARTKEFGPRAQALEEAQGYAWALLDMEGGKRG